MRKRIVIMIIALALALSGCQLAKPDAEAQKEKDMLVGVFVTAEYLDLFDRAQYYAEHPEALLGGSLKDPPMPEAKLWATKTGSGANVSYEFEGVEGLIFSMYLITTDNSQFTRLDAAPGICDGHREVFCTDDGVTYDLSGTIYMAHSQADTIFYINPVYQTPEGDVYLVSGTGIHYSGDLAGAMTQKLSETATRTENGKTSEYSSSVEIRIEGIRPAEALTVLYMDSSSNPVRRVSYGLEEVPEALDIPKTAAFVLVEEPIDGEVRRSLYLPEDSFLEYYRPLENGICEKATVTLNWPE